jgi:hypothetical protein
MKILHLGIIVAIGVIVVTLSYFLLLPRVNENSILTIPTFESTLWYDNKPYDEILFSSEINRPLTFDGVTFVYGGNATIHDGHCDTPYYEHTHPSPIMNFKVTLRNGTTINEDMCWPPNYNDVCHSGPHGGISCPPPLRYNIGWFDENKTAAVAWCNSSHCPLGSILYLVEK